MPGRLGVDFGTSNTVLAVWDEARKEGVPLHVPDYGRTAHYRRGDHQECQHRCCGRECAAENQRHEHAGGEQDGAEENRGRSHTPIAIRNNPLLGRYMGIREDLDKFIIATKGPGRGIDYLFSWDTERPWNMARSTMPTHDFASILPTITSVDEHYRLLS